MAELWPEDLPQCFLAGTVGWQIGDGRIRTPVEAGPSKTRRRTSAVSDFVSGQMKLSTEQWASLKNFISVTILGTGSFTFPDPDGGSGSDLLCRFADTMPNANRVRNKWIANLQFEVLP